MLEHDYYIILRKKLNKGKTTKTPKLYSREEPGIFKQTFPDYALFKRSTYFRRRYADCFNATTSTEKLPHHHFCLAHRVGKTATNKCKKFASLRPVVRTRRSYKRLIKRQKSLQRLAKYGHEMLMSLPVGSIEPIFIIFV
jgi:hypothetical protein